MKNNIVKLIVIFALLFPMIGETIEVIIGINSLDYDLALSQGINNNDSYGFIIPVNSSQTYEMQTGISNLVNELLRNKAVIYWITCDVSIKSCNLNKIIAIKSVKFEPGSFMVTFSNEPNQNLITSAIVYRYNCLGNVKTYHIMEAIKNLDMYRIIEPKIAIHAGKNVGTWLYSEVLSKGGFSNSERLDWNNISNRLNNDDFNVFIWGAGIGDPIAAILAQTNKDAIMSIRKFVRDGGGYIGSCYGGYEISSGSFLPFNSIKAYFPNFPSLFFPSFSTRFAIKAFGGGGYIDVKITDTSNPIALGLPSEIKNCFYWEGPMFLGIKGNTNTVAVIENINNSHWGFDIDLSDYSLLLSLRDRWVNFALGKPIWVTLNFGDGKIVAFGDHPEAHDDYPRIVHNAVFYTTSKGPFNVDIDDHVSFSNIITNANGPYRGYIGEPMSFSPSISGGNPPYYYIWDLGDGVIKTDENPKYFFNETGVYTVILTGQDGDNNINYDITTITINEKLDIYVDDINDDYYVNDTIYFSSSASGGFPPYSYHWDFGDGEESYEQYPIHSYWETGEYNFILTITDDLGTSDIYSGIVSIKERNDDNDNNDDDNHNGSNHTLNVLIGMTIVIVSTLTIVLLFLNKRK